MTFSTVRLGIEVLLVIGIIVLLSYVVGKQSRKVVIPPALRVERQSAQAYIVVKDKRITAICSQEASAKKYADENGGQYIELGIDNGSDVSFELVYDGDVLEFKIASW